MPKTKKSKTTGKSTAAESANKKATRATRKRIKPRNQTRPVVICFRLTQDQFDEIVSRLEKNPIVRIDSPRQLCRKWVADVVAGRLAYKNPEHARIADSKLDEASA